MFLLSHNKHEYNFRLYWNLKFEVSEKCSEITSEIQETNSILDCYHEKRCRARKLTDLPLPQMTEPCRSCVCGHVFEDAKQIGGKRFSGTPFLAACFRLNPAVNHPFVTQLRWC